MPVLTIPNSFSANNIAISADVNANFNAVATLLNSTKLDSTNIQTGGIIAANLAAGSIGGSGNTDLSTHIVDNSTLVLTSNQLSVPTGGIGTTQLAANAVTAAKIANTTITASQIANSTITGSQIASNVALAGTGVTAGGNYVATADPSSGGRLKIMYGVCASGGGSSGAGWSQTKINPGAYSVTFSNAFTSAPVVTLTCARDGSGNYMAATFIVVPTTTGFQYQCWLNNGSFAVSDAQANFIAVGLY